jgi:ribosome-binding protein aMBF1 (putative translation factor)
MDWQTHKQQLLKGPEFQKALKESELEYRVTRALIEARTKKGLTQKQLAKKLNTTQSVISRAESARSLPSLTFLKRLAEALDVQLEVKFV